MQQQRGSPKSLNLPIPKSLRGFTLIELLTVITIIGILVSLLLPAVQSARESARGLQCRNNLKQLGLALHSYHAANEVFPISIGPDYGNGKGWITSLLPQLEQQALYDQFVPGFVGNFSSNEGILNLACRDAVKTQLSVLQCPSDSSVQQLSTQQFQWQGIPVAVTSYKGVMGDCQIGGVSSAWQGTNPPGEGSPGLNGIFYRGNCMDGGISIAKIRDGASNTLMVGEDVPEHNHHSAAYYANGDYASCDGPINYMPDPPTPDHWWNVITFRSRHSGGANFCLADGSLHFLSQTIDQTLYRALSTKAGGEPVEVPW